MRFIATERAAGSYSPTGYPFLSEDSPEQGRIAAGLQPEHDTTCTKPCCVTAKDSS